MKSVASIGVVINSWYMSQISAVGRAVAEGNYLRIYFQDGVRASSLLQSPKSRGDRRSVVSFSDKSRWLFLERVNTMRFLNPVFITLTFHDVVDRETGKRALKRVIDSLRRRGTWGLWKQEFQERGAVHYHLIVCSESEQDYSWIVEFWHKYARREGWETDYAVLLHSVDVQAAETDRVAAYVAKYVVKGGEVQREFGRYWGVWGRSKAFRDRIEYFVPGDALRSVISKLPNDLRAVVELRRSGLICCRIFCGDILGGGAERLFSPLTSYRWRDKI